MPLHIPPPYYHCKILFSFLPLAPLCLLSVPLSGQACGFKSPEVSQTGLSGQARKLPGACAAKKTTLSLCQCCNPCLLICYSKFERPHWRWSWWSHQMVHCQGQKILFSFFFFFWMIWWVTCGCSLCVQSQKDKIRVQSLPGESSTGQTCPIKCDSLINEAIWFLVLLEWPLVRSRHECVTCMRLILGLLLLLQTLAVHRNAAVTVQLLSFRWRRLVLVGCAVVGSWLVLLAAVPPERQWVVRDGKTEFRKAGDQK